MTERTRPHRTACGAWMAVMAVLTAFAIRPAAAADIKRVDLAPAPIAVPDLTAIGRPQTLRVHEGKLYVAGTAGVAALDAGGQLLWTVSLPEADARSLDVDANGVAFTSFSIVGYERGKGAAGALAWGEPSVKLNTADARVGLLTSDGKLLWNIAVAEVSALSPPALAKDRVAVLGSRSLYLYQRADGAQVGAAVGMFTNYLGITANSNTRMPVTQPLWQGDNVFAGHQSWFKKVSAEGKELAATKELGKNFTFLLSGPVQCKELIVLAEASYPEGNIFTGKKARVYASNGDLKPIWYAQTEDDETGVADVVCDDETIYAVSNAMISALSYDGKTQWQYTSKGGILVPGTHRGMVHAGSLPIAHQLVAGRQVVAAGPYLYVTSRLERNWKGKQDVITVFDTKKGSIIEQIDPKSIVVDMAVFGSNLALVTGDGLKLATLKP